MRTETINVSGKGPGKPSEDRAIAQKQFGLYGVLDGSSELAGSNLALDMAGGLWSSLNMARQLVKARRNTGSEWKHDLGRLVKDAEAVVYNSGRFADVPTWQLPGSCGFIASITDTHIHWLQFGDCVGVIFRKARATILGEDAVFPYDSQVLQAMRSPPRPIENPEIQRMLRENRQIRNIVGYAGIDGNLNLELCRQGVVERAGIEKMVIMSDGWFHDPRDIEWTATQIYRDGLNLSQRNLHILEVRDPDCTIYPRFKRHDDKAAVRITF